MTLGSCRVKKEDSVGAGPQNMFVNLFLMAQYAGQSNTIHDSVLLQEVEEDLHAACLDISPRILHSGEY